MDLKKFTLDFGCIGIANILCSFSGIIMIPIFTKILGVYSYGLWVQVFVTIGLVKPLVEIGLLHAMLRFLAGETDRNKIREGFYSILLVIVCAGILVLGLLIIISEPLANLVFDGNRSIVILTAFCIPAWYAFQICKQFFVASRQMKKYAIITIADTYGQVGIISILILAGYGLYTLVISYLIWIILLVLIVLVIIIKSIGVSVPKFTEIKKYLHYGVPIIPGSLSGWVVHSSDRYMIGYFLGPLSVGYYTPAYALGSFILGLTTVIGFILAPTLIERYERNKIEEVKTYLRYTMKYFSAIAIPFIFGASLLSKQILIILSTEAIATSAYLVVPVVAVGSVMLGFGTFFSQIIMLTKKTKIFGIVGTLTAITNFSLNLLFIPRIGILGAAITTCIAFTLGTGIVSFYSFKYIKFKKEKRFTFKVILSSIIMSIIILTWNPVGLINVIGCIIFCMLFYFILLLLMKGLNSEEINLFKRTLMRR